MHIVRRRRGTRGSAMVELLVTTAIASIALVTTAATVVTSSKETRALSQIRAAAPVLGSLLDEAHCADYGTLSTVYSNLKRTITTMPGTSKGGTALFTVTDVSTGSTRWTVKKVSVTLSWNGPAGPLSVTGVTYCSDRSGTAVPVIPADTL